MPFDRLIPHPLRSTPRRDNSVVFEYNGKPNFDEDADLAYESTQTHIESGHLPVGRGQPSWNNSDRLEVYPTNTRTRSSSVAQRSARRGVVIQERSRPSIARNP